MNTHCTFATGSNGHLVSVGTGGLEAGQTGAAPVGQAGQVTKVAQTQVFQDLMEEGQARIIME